MNIHYASVSPGYFAAIGTRLLAGRDFTSGMTAPPRGFSS